MKRVWIEEGCTSCGLCESICPEVFEMPDEAVVKEEVDYENFRENIKEAAESCPLVIIKYKE